MSGEKTTLYLDPDVKAQTFIHLIKEKQITGERKSLSELVNELLKEYLEKAGR